MFIRKKHIFHISRGYFRERVNPLFIEWTNDQSRARNYNSKISTKSDRKEIARILVPLGDYETRREAYKSLEVVKHNNLSWDSPTNYR